MYIITINQNSYRTTDYHQEAMDTLHRYHTDGYTANCIWRDGFASEFDAMDDSEKKQFINNK